MKKKKGKKGAGGDGKRQVTNLREAPYSLKDGDVIAVVDRLEDPEGHADLTRADDEVSASDDSVPVFFVLSVFFMSTSVVPVFFSRFFLMPTSMVPIFLFFILRFCCPCNRVRQFFSVGLFYQFLRRCQWCHFFPFFFLFLSM